MTLHNREQAAEIAEKTTRNKEGMCQQVTRGYFMGKSAGDRDHDGDADANDGWLSEPQHARHAGDRHPPRGVPVSFRNARHGHRAISLGNEVIRSTDFDGSTKRYREGVVGNGTLEEIERAMGVEYVGWSETITGDQIPLPKPPPPPSPTRLTNFHKGSPQYDLKILDKAVENGRSDIKLTLQRINVAVRKLPKESSATRVGKFLRAYNSDRVLRMGLLHRAVHKGGRHFTVEHVYDELKALIKSLPER